MTPGNGICEQQQLPVRAFTSDLGRALASPRRAWELLRRWALLAQHADLPCAQLLRYRCELLADREFQSHLERCLRDVPYIFCTTAITPTKPCCSSSSRPIQNLSRAACC